MVDDDDFSSSQGLLGDDQGPQRLRGSASSVSIDVGVALLQAEEFSWVKTSVHAGQDKDFSVFCVCEMLAIYVNGKLLQLQL